MGPRVRGDDSFDLDSSRIHLALADRCQARVRQERTRHQRHPFSFAVARRDRHAGRHCDSHAGVNLMPSAATGPRLVPYLLYEKEASGILWIKFNQPEKMNALVGTAEENGTVAKVGEYMRAADDDPDVRVIVL